MNAGHYVSFGYCVMTMWIKNSGVKKKEKKWLSGVMLQFPVLVAIYLYTIIVMVFTIACRFAMENIFQVKSATSFNKIPPKFLLLRYIRE